MRKLIILFVLGFTSMACSDWLEISPKTERPEKEMFTTVSGFKDALTGVYLELINDQAYGEYLILSKVDNLVNFWTVTANTREEAFSFHNYADAKAEALIQNMYGQLYKIILAANAILENVDQKKELFAPGEYEAVKGECLAIRGMCHFDLLRLFGPVPSLADGTPVLSYVTRVSSELNPLLSFAKYKELLYADMKEAETLLKTHLDEGANDDYFAYRNIRMNWYAVRALWARIHFYFGEMDEAYQAAMEVIGMTKEDGDKLFRLGTSEDVTNGDYAFSCEDILALYRFDMDKKYTNLFTGNSLYKGQNEKTVKNDLFGNTGTDIREMYQWELTKISNGGSYYVLKKYKTRERKSSADPDIQNIPLIRLSELYMIAIETGAKSEVAALWDEFLMKRNVNFVELPESQEDRLPLLISEYQKEFYAEGQVFYLYKRLNLSKDSKSWLWAPGKMELNYVLPLPKTEIVNN